jgi:glycosyltransferase involved in cell wall biosynthesis
MHSTIGRLTENAGQGDAVLRERLFNPPERLLNPPTPLVSVVIPTHNRPEMLREAVASVRTQRSFSDYEIIIVSNGEANPQASHDVAMHYACRFIKLPKGNRSLARNVAIKEARGEWIAFLDDDDLWHRNKLVLQLAFAAQTGAGCVFTDFVLRDVNTGIDRSHHIQPVLAVRCKGLSAPESFMVLRAGTGGCSTVLIRRQVLLDLGGFDTKMVLCEDWDMWRRVSQRCQVAWLDEILSILRTHSANGEDHAVLRPWRCTYWEIYHSFKAIRACPPGLRHMIPATLKYLAARTLYLHPIFVMKHIERRTPLRGLRLRPRRAINALFGREIFSPSRPPWWKR